MMDLTKFINTECKFNGDTISALISELYSNLEYHNKKFFLLELIQQVNG